MIRMSLFCVGAFLRMHGSNVKYPQFWGWIEGRWKFLKIGLSEAFGIAFLLAFQHSPPSQYAYHSTEIVVHCFSREASIHAGLGGI